MLSIKDLVAGRELFHYHLMTKKNVIATGIGKYLIHESDFDETYDLNHSKRIKQSNYTNERTLKNSKITESSWQCILVFVNKWESEEDLMKSGSDNIIPKSVYMLDGTSIPICVVLSSEIEIKKLQQNQNLFDNEFALSIRTFDKK